MVVTRRGCTLLCYPSTCLSGYPFPVPKCSITCIQTVCGWEGVGGVKSCFGNHILKEFYTIWPDSEPKKLLDHPKRKKIRLIEDNEKCRHLKSIVCKETLRRVFIFLRPRTSYPSPLYTLHIYLYKVYLFTQKRGDGEILEPERRLERQQLTKLGRIYQRDRLYLQSIRSEKDLPLSPFTGQCFWMTTFALLSISLIF